MPSDVGAHAKSGFSFLISWVIEWMIATRNRKWRQTSSYRHSTSCLWLTIIWHEAVKCLRPSRSFKRVPCSASNLIKILRFWAETNMKRENWKGFWFTCARGFKPEFWWNEKFSELIDGGRRAGGRWRWRLISARGLEQKPREIRLAFAEIWVTRRGMTIDLR